MSPMIFHTFSPFVLQGREVFSSNPSRYMLKPEVTTLEMPLSSRAEPFSRSSLAFYEEKNVAVIHQESSGKIHLKKPGILTWVDVPYSVYNYCSVYNNFLIRLTQDEACKEFYCGLYIESTG